MTSIKPDKKRLKIRKTSFELGYKLWGKYASGDNDLSTTYKQKIKSTIK